MGEWVESFERGKGARQRQTRRRVVGEGQELVPYPTDDPSIQAYLRGSEGSFADRNIVKYINRMNDVGIETIASCSGMRRDHEKEMTYTRGEGATGSYLSVVLPEEVAEHGFTGGIFSIPEYTVKNRPYIDALLEVGRKAGWLAEESRYLMSVPVIHYSIPVTGSIEGDRKALEFPTVVIAQANVSKIMADPRHSGQEFLDAIDVRDGMWKKAYARYGGDKPKSDNDIDKYWKKLTKELEQVAPKLKKIK